MFLNSDSNEDYFNNDISLFLFLLALFRVKNLFWFFHTYSFVNVLQMVLGLQYYYFRIFQKNLRKNKLLFKTRRVQTIVVLKFYLKINLLNFIWSRFSSTRTIFCFEDIYCELTKLIHSILYMHYVHKK